MATYRELTLTLHGLEQYNEAVDGEVFARKFAAFMRGLGKSDAAANGVRRHKFLIAELRKNTATAVIREQLARQGPPPRSGISYYVEGVSSVHDETQFARFLPRGIVKEIATLPRGAGHTFSFAEVKAQPTDPAVETTVIRIDEFLEKRANRILQDATAPDVREQNYFEGTAYGSFDGVLKVVDLRGDMKKSVLLLSAGGKPIECIVNSITVTRLGDSLDKRVIAYGLAHYDRSSGLPARLDVRHLDIVSASPGLARWRGAFEIPHDDHDKSGWDRS